jgi:hypothetical protein
MQPARASHMPKSGQHEGIVDESRLHTVHIYHKGAHDRTVFCNAPVHYNTVHSLTTVSCKQ